MRPTSVILADFDYSAPKSLEEALKEKKERKGAYILAGGTDLVPKMRGQVIKPVHLIDISGIKELDYIKEQEGEVRIGAATKISRIIDSKVKIGILLEACEKLGNPLTRNKATIGGNLCNASPAADTATPLMVLGAQLVLKSLNGERVVPVENFFVGPGKTVLKEDEILTEIRIKPPEDGAKAKFVKVGLRKADAISVVNCAVLLKFQRGIVTDAKIALGSVAPTPILTKEAQKILIGNKLSEELVEKCAQIAANEAKPIDDVRGSAKYRKLLVEGCVKKALRELMEG
ncbi:MAG: xanthine dehydrogenase family protein subunit M [Candidatus Hadarchaeum sp.]|uniref:FAD binding domain-containing protein n=1 Tax=Candidatus Hadarchaeum sp. TaxID=2883567 RepID=UPI00317BCA01